MIISSFLEAAVAAGGLILLYSIRRSLMMRLSRHADPKTLSLALIILADEFIQLGADQCLVEGFLL